MTSAAQLGSGGTPAACGQDIAATGFLTSYSYDALSNLLTVSQSSLGQRTFAYDSLSRLTTATNPESGTTSYSYDANGNLTQRTRPSPNLNPANPTVTTAYQYDALNRLTQKSYSDGVTLPALFGYDQTNVTMGSQNLTIANSIGRLSWTCVEQQSSPYCNPMTTLSYDPMGRTAELWQLNPVNGNNIWVAYGYDLLGDETSRNLNGNTYSAKYNAAAQLTSFTATDYTDATNPANLLSSGGYDALGHLISATFANGLSQSWAYDNRGRPDAMAVGTSCSAGTCSGSTVYSYGVGYSGDSDVLSATDSVNGTWSYTYDGFNRLATSNCSATCPKGTSTAGFSYVYDRYGNRWQQNGPSTMLLTFSNSQNHMDGYTYDAAGNLTNDKFHSYAYDAENRIVAVDAATTYGYDAQDRRVSKTAGGSVTDFIYDREGRVMLYNSNQASGSEPFAEVNVAGLHLGTYVLNSTVTDTIFYYDHADWLGTERARTNLAGTACETVQNLPFGDGQTIAGSCGDISPMHFTGKERDGESGLDYFGARYDASSMGRFMTPDWSAKPRGVPYAVLDDPQSLNLYSYVQNNPLSRTDPDGHLCADSARNCGSDQAKGAQVSAQNTAAQVESPCNCTTVVGGFGQGGANNTTRTVTEKDGVETTTTTVTSANFVNGKFASATISTEVVTFSDGRYTSVQDSSRSLTYSEAAHALGADTLGAARDASLPSFAYQFGRALGSDIYNHPINYAAHAIGFALPFFEVGEAAEGLITGAEALKTAVDLNKETQGGNQ